MIEEIPPGRKRGERHWQESYCVIDAGAVLPAAESSSCWFRSPGYRVEA